MKAVKNFFDGLKDFIYDSIDYFIMIAIVVGVVFIIGWRLDILFAKDTLDIPNPPPIVVDGRDIHDKDDNNDSDVVEADPDLPPEDDTELEEPSSGSDLVDNPDPVTSEPATVSITINIPDGTLPSGIGAILESNGLVSNKNDFVIKAQSMDLDRKLQSGTFKINNTSSLEEIIKIIAKQN